MKETRHPSHLSLHCPVPELLCQEESHLVVLRCLLELSQEDVSVAEVTVCSALCTPVTELLGYLESLLVVVDCLGEVSKKIVNVTEISTSSTLGCSILDMDLENNI